MTIDKCSEYCVAEQPLLDTVDGREHDNCPDLQWLAQCAEGDKAAAEFDARGATC